MRTLIITITLLSAPADAADWPPITAIHFEGNDTTRETVLLREMTLQAGDPADPAAIEQDRQAILDLGLFRRVSIHQEPDGDGVALTVNMTEKRFLLPVPHIDATTDGGHSYGAQLRWNNLLGLNHNLNMRAVRGQHEGDRLRESEDLISVSYDAPYLFNDRDGIAGTVEYIDRVAPGEAGSFDETIGRVEVRFSRDFRDARPRRGWIGSAGVSWRSQDTAGAAAPPPDGRTTALLLGVDYSDLRFHVYSESGTLFSGRLEAAVDGMLSDFSYRRLDLAFAEHIALEAGAHHTLNLLASGGWADGGTGIRNTYGLGGSVQLRGYDTDFIEGERFVYAAVEYLRPVLGYDWLRVLVLAETGWTGGSVTPAPDGGPFANIGVGVRVRLPWFVNVDIEAGIAYPLRGGDGMQVFAGGD